MGLRVAVACATLAGLATAARADDDPSRAIVFHGFASQGALLSSDNNFLARSSRGSLEYTEAGLDVFKQLDDRLTFGAQLFTHRLGPIGDYKARFDWFDLDYHWRDWLGLRAGRTKIPYGLYNDTSDIDAAHPVALLPQAVYAAGNRDALLAQTGVELYGFADLGRAGNLDYRVFGGTIFVDPTETTAVGSIDVPYIAGGRVMWEPLTGLRAGASFIATKLDATVVQPGMPAPTTFDLKLKIAVASIEYTKDAFQFALEIARWWDTYKTSDPMFASGEIADLRGYGLASYRALPWLQLTSYYALYYPNSAMRDGRAGHQLDAALSLRFDITPHWIVKLEGHDMRGTAELSSRLNDGLMPSQLANKWWLAVAKTTVYF